MEKAARYNGTTVKATEGPTPSNSPVVLGHKVALGGREVPGSGLGC